MGKQSSEYTEIHPVVVQGTFSAGLWKKIHVNVPTFGLHSSLVPLQEEIMLELSTYLHVQRSRDFSYLTLN